MRLKSSLIYLLIISIGLSLFACTSTDNTESESEEAAPKVYPIGPEWWANLPPVWKAYFMDKQEISDPPTPEQFEKIRQIDALDLFNEADLGDMTPIQSMTNLRAIWCDGIGKLENVEPFTALPELRELSLGETGVADITPLAKVENLEKLELFKTEVGDISALSSLDNLTFVDLTETKVSDISALSDAKKLEVIYLSKTDVSSLEPLKDLDRLREVSFGDTKIEDLTPLKNMEKLTSIAFFGTPVKSLEPLKGLDSLTMIYYTGSQVSDEEKEAFQKLRPEAQIF